MTRTFALLGVPSSAGAHWPGQEKAPRALREAGLVERLRAAGLKVEDYGDLPRTRYRFVVHFDVDVIDFVDFPVADVPQHNAGLKFEEAIACLDVFATSPAFGGLVITEFNPDHADEGGELAARFVRGVAGALGDGGR
jgi:arginase family enzyme